MHIDDDFAVIYLSLDLLVDKFSGNNQLLMPIIIHQLMTITADDRCLFMLFFCCFKNCDALTLRIPTTQGTTKALRQMTESRCTTPLDLD